MTEAIDALKNWPVLLQGIIGSALFSLITFLGQKIFNYMTEKHSKLSKKKKITALKNEILRLKAVSAKDSQDIILFASLLWFRASRFFIKGFIWITMGLCFNQFIGIFSVVGFIGGLYYFFTAYEIIKPIKSVNEEEKEKRLKKIELEIKHLEN